MPTKRSLTKDQIAVKLYTDQKTWLLAESARRSKVAGRMVSESSIIREAIDGLKAASLSKPSSL